MDASVMEAVHVPLDFQLLLTVALKLTVNVLYHCLAAVGVSRSERTRDGPLTVALTTTGSSGMKVQTAARQQNLRSPSH